MPRNGNGVYNLPEPPFTPGTVISSAAVNDDLDDIATALTGSLPRDGQAGMSGQLKLADGSVGAPALAFSNETNTGFIHPGTGELSVVIQGVAVTTFTSAGINGTLPIGLVSDFAGAAVPALWILCYGQPVSRTTYAALFNIIGVTYGSGDGVTTFNVPDCRGVVSVGAANMGGTPTSVLTSTGYGADPTILGNPGGAQVRSLSLGNLPAITPAGSVSSSSGSITGTAPVQGSYPGTTIGGAAAIGTNTSGLLSVPLTINTPAILSTFTGSTGGGSSTPFSVVQPSIIFNRIIYAGA